MVIAVIQNYPLLSLLVLSLIITFLQILAYKKFSNQEEIRQSKEKLKELQEKIKQEKDSEKVMILQKEMWQINMTHLRHSMKPLMITFIPSILIFLWLRKTFLPFGVLIPYNITFPGSKYLLSGLWDGAGWLVVYILSSIIFNLILRKLMKVH